MVSTQDIKNKEIINIYDGRSLGFATDVEIDLDNGKIDGIVVPVEKGFFSFFAREGEYIIKWKDIRKIGEDVILVDVNGLYEADEKEDMEM